MTTNDSEPRLVRRRAAVLHGHLGETSYQIVEPGGGSTAISPEFLFLHGAGAASMARVEAIAIDLGLRKCRSVIFDAFGHGQSSGDIGDQTLSTRLQQAQSVLDALIVKPTVLVGFSMGAHVAVGISRANPQKIAGLVLCAPAAYAIEAEQVRFAGGFTEILRSSDSWKRSACFSQVASFSGPILLCTPQNDEVIPDGVTQAYRQAMSSNVQSSHIVIDDASHQLGSWLTTHKEARQQFVDMLVRTFCEAEQ